MLRILGSPKRFCDGLTRRDMLVAGGLGLCGLGLPDLLRAEDSRAPKPADARLGKSFGKAKSCILLFLYGSPSQLETFDMKPDAAPEVRGEFKPIRSRLPGLDVCELLPNAAKVMDKVTVRAVDDASVSDPRRGLRHHRGAADRRADGAEPAR